MSSFPIDDVIPDLLTALEGSRTAVLQAPPGAGKTTRVPLALLKAPWLGNGRIVMLEPRRLAATNAARWMAKSLGDEVGGTIGYAIRFDRKISSRTRVEVVTEGILTRRLHSDPFLEGVGVVIFDEFHERSIHADLALALCRDVQLGLREDLRIIVMSATLDAGPLAALLGNAPVISSTGRSHPVDLRYLSAESGDDIATLVSRGVARALAETDGDILAFLPGAGEIRRCERILAESGLTRDILVAPLYGDLSFEAQERAIVPAARRKVVLATNIAETSLTIEGVSTVVDGGFCRRLRFDPATGLNRLAVERISAASATQRAGRAGRLGPGVCYRLWTDHTHHALIPADPPEITISDLAPLALDLAAWGVADFSSLAWLDSPPSAALEEGKRLLAGLGAVDRKGRITEIGRRMAELPLHPRLAHMLLLGKERGWGALACDVAALLSERDIFRGGERSGAGERSDSDMLERVEALARWRTDKSGAGGRGDLQACRTVDRTAAHLRRLIAVKAGENAAAPGSEAVGLQLAGAYPDRIALAREGGGRRYLLANGRGARLSERSSVHDEPLMVAYVVDRGEGGDDLIRQASVLGREAFRREFAEGICRQRVVSWDGREGRVVAREEERYGALVLGSRPVAATADEASGALLEGITRGGGIDLLGWSPRAQQMRARVRFLGRIFPDEGWPDFSDGQLLATLAAWLGPHLAGVRTLAAVASVDLLPPLQALLDWEHLRRLDDEAPTHLAVPSGSRLPLDYGTDGPPVLAVKLQEMFGLADTPTVARGRVPVVVHLLSPAGRPLQVTTDLRGFWNGAYREVKKEMKGRYPKHPWPDDPWSAMPTRKTKKGSHGT
ncbi:ATP-dependent helicase HrpB [Geobacter pickeringii]|uniref:ATP-dependent helicase n=1 Tax=Geobacter pickeringii TaxID=345632 RepID=A0A0B5B924_9BACT|nr:ATP-dependent helicase HrpB [Geobacter pickeringii]AJE03052.1 ATP-dependent helicase [Geobacter pickeringii]